eukprot:TRINITY_DN18059_c0_g1_i1.p1 TRINITY_DN18059_c0_g1~~TRINITY_DN18059_c0_g1_i1.p1  ORF type:complete len:590 (+),score=147.70 TRINITY_DN18059_c0_g1_i1:87-1772(+)
MAKKPMRGQYILGKTIGEGTFGKVKLGTHIFTGEKVAVKILERERIKEVADVERVAREIHILKIIRHPHVIQLYESVVTPGQLYLIMEYCNGGELFDHIVACGRVEEREACRFFHQILSGVEQIHKINVVHRDLKPENLLLDENSNIKIVDFGLSNMYKEDQLLKTACGSPCYAAPEMIAGHHYVPSGCDVWSCGVIVFALVCGYLPFEDQNTAALYRKILHAEYQTPTFISEDARDLITKMLTTDPEKRANLKTIRAHPWYRQIPNAALRWEGNKKKGPQHEELNAEILEKLETFGFSHSEAVQSLKEKRHNALTTTYYLLLEKQRRELLRREAEANQAIQRALQAKGQLSPWYGPDESWSEWDAADSWASAWTAATWQEDDEWSSAWAPKDDEWSSAWAPKDEWSAAWAAQGNGRGEVESWYGWSHEEEEEETEEEDDDGAWATWADILGESEQRGRVAGGGVRGGSGRGGGGRGRGRSGGGKAGSGNTKGKRESGGGGTGAGKGGDGGPWTATSNDGNGGTVNDWNGSRVYNNVSRGKNGGRGRGNGKRRTGNTKGTP